MMRAWNLFLDAYPLVLTPFLMRPTYPWNYDAQGRAQIKDLFDAAIYSYGINYLALPAGVVPVDLVEDLPAGDQLEAESMLPVLTERIVSICNIYTERTPMSTILLVK